MNMSTADKGVTGFKFDIVDGMIMITVDKGKEHHIRYGECGMNMMSIRLDMQRATKTNDVNIVSVEVITVEKREQLPV